MRLDVNEIREHLLCDGFLGAALATAEAEIMHAALKKSIDMFAWTSTDMPGLSSDVITHRL